MTTAPADTPAAIPAAPAAEAPTAVAPVPEAPATPEPAVAPEPGSAPATGTPPDFETAPVLPTASKASEADTEVDSESLYEKAKTRIEELIGNETPASETAPAPPAEGLGDAAGEPEILPVAPAGPYTASPVGVETP